VAVGLREPALKVLYTSGYMHGAVDGTRESAAQIGHLLGKPYRRRDLAAKVRASSTSGRRRRERPAGFSYSQCQTAPGLGFGP
jgi:hypothetical protein